MRRLVTRGLGAAVLTFTLIGVAHAHGGMAGPDEMGPPLGMSVAIGLACYWLITLWPNRRKDENRKQTGRANGRTTK
jgi:hypothetical protein